jgi:hypothetical protein
MEVWKSIVRLPGYEVSNIGNVRSSKGTQERLLKQATASSGYKLVCLFVDGKRITSYVHRLVAEAFIPAEKINIKLGLVNHKDRNKTNNVLENLEWVSPVENAFHWKDTDRYFFTQQIGKICGNVSLDQLIQILEFCKKVER